MEFWVLGIDSRGLSLHGIKEIDLDHGHFCIGLYYIMAWFTASLYRW
jgi:hypothetical protein